MHTRELTANQLKREAAIPFSEGQTHTDREEADEAFLDKAQLVVNGVLADPTEGDDSALYEAMGYTRKSERRSGLTRKRNEPPTP